MKKQVTDSSYSRFVNKLIAEQQKLQSYDEIMKMAVGGSFEIVGILERELLIQHGLRSQDYLIDVGCGSGRLAKPLSEYLEGPYLGIDIVPQLVDYARQTVARSDWDFRVAQGFQVPEQENMADFVCFFSVLTHLRHEESYLYLREARRVLKPDGKIIFSYLDFQNPHNWSIFNHGLERVGEDEPLNQFISVDAIKIWADRLQLGVMALNRAGRIRLSGEVNLYGKPLKGTHLLGQSVCVLSKSSGPTWRRKINNGLFRVANRLQRLQI